MVRLLIDHGADANVGKCFTDETPLHEAARHGHTEVVQLLLERGARAGARNKNGVTALHFAVRAGHKDASDLLLAHGASMDISVASGLGALDEMEALLDKDPDLLAGMGLILGNRAPLDWPHALAMQML